SDTDDVVLRLLGGERDAPGLRVEAQLPGALVLGAEALAHDLRPHPAGGPELGHLLKDVVVAVEEEGQAGSEAIDLQARVKRGLNVGDPLGQREGDLLDGGTALFAEVVAADRD